MKFRLIKNMDEKDLIIYNQDDKLLTKGFENISTKKVQFSVNHLTKYFSIRDGYVFNGENNNIFNAKNFSIPGKHNISNFFAAATCAKFLKVSEKSIIKTFGSFSSVKHRLEYVENINGITFINDSKATNIDSVVKEINTNTFNRVFTTLKKRWKNLTTTAFWTDLD